MRVSTPQIFDTGINGITNTHALMMKLQSQITTGRRILTPSDDPVASAQALIVTQSELVNDRNMANQGQARSSLGYLDSTLGSISDLMQNVIERTIQAGNGTFSDAERHMIATEMRSRYDELVALANTQDGEGNYIFSGFQTQKQPFDIVSASNAPTGTPVPAVIMPGAVQPLVFTEYHGDDGRRELQVEAGRLMQVSEPGSDVFVRIRDKNGKVTDESVFTSLGKFIEALEADPFDNATYNTAYSEALDNFYATFDNTQRIRTTVGSRLAEIDALENTAYDRKLQYQEVLSNLQDLDYADALSMLSKQQILLEAAQKSYMTVTGLGLFNRM